MSLILEALRKSEAERRRGEAPDLLRNDFAVAPHQQARWRAWYWVAVPLAVLPLLLWWPPERERSSVPGTADRPVVAPAASPPAVHTAATASLPIVSHLRPAPAVESAPAPPPPQPAPTSTGTPGADDAPVPVATLPSAQRKALPPLRLSMHLWNEDPARRLAILDGQRVGEGDRVGDAVVAEISRQGVVLDWNGERILVPLP